MFKLTEKAKAFNKFFIQHLCKAEYGYIVELFSINVTEGYASTEEATEYEGLDNIREYTPEEVLEAAEEGYDWPFDLGLVEGEKNLESIDEELLKACVRAVDENNRVNNVFGAEWRDWMDGQHIIQVYAPGEWCDKVCLILDRAVESNGETLKEDLPLIERKIKGQNFSGSFFDRK